MTEWHKARNKPIWVEYREVEGDYEVVHTLEGVLIAYRGVDYIMRGTHGEQYPIKIYVFNDNYEVE